jgi:hypothetical protein
MYGISCTLGIGIHHEKTTETTIAKIWAGKRALPLKASESRERVEIPGAVEN